MARHSQAIRGYQAIHGWPGSTVGPEQFLCKEREEVSELGKITA